MTPLPDSGGGVCRIWDLAGLTLALSCRNLELPLAIGGYQSAISGRGLAVLIVHGLQSAVGSP